MKALIASEFYKVTKNKWVLGTWLAGSLLSLIFFINPDNKTLYDKMYFMGDFFPILVCALVCGLWSSEYSYKTIKDLVSSKYKRTSVFISKLAITFFAVFILVFIYTYTGILFANASYHLTMFVLQGLLVISQTFIMVLFAVSFQSYSKVAMAGLVFLIFDRITNSMYESKAYLGFTSHTFLVLFYNTENWANISYLSKDILLYLLIGLICLCIASVIFIKSETK